LKSYSFSPWKKEQRNRTQTKGIGTMHSSKRERWRDGERERSIVHGYVGSSE